MPHVQSKLFQSFPALAMVWLISFSSLSSDCSWAQNTASTLQRANGVSDRAIRIESALVVIAESVDVPAEQSGVLVELKVEAGQSVGAGELVARVKDDTLSLKLEQARMEHELAKMAAESRVDLLYSQKSYDVAVSDLRRSESANMRVPNSVTVSKLEKQGLERDRAELKLEQARRDLEMAAYRTRITSGNIRMAQSELAKTKLNAPMSGLVVEVKKRVGEWVEASEVVCTVVRTDRVWIQGLLHAQQAAQIKVGDPVQIEFSQDWVQSKKVPGKIVYISPEANSVNGMLQVRAEFANDQARVPTGLKADIVIDQ